MNADDDIDPPDRLTQLPDRIVQIREALLPGGAFEWELAAALDCSRRKVQELKLPLRHPRRPKGVAAPIVP